MIVSNALGGRFERGWTVSIDGRSRSECELEEVAPAITIWIGIGSGDGRVCIFTAEDALAKRDAGAKLVQLYTGFVYKGPQLIHDIIKAW
ncbi:hypothetical protein N9733_10315 [Akkermansiaceae bacterium]|nr:hypothetical protein [Akkermansiaceae bacterium]